MTDATCAVSGCTEAPKVWDRDGGWCRAHMDEMDAARRADEKRATTEAGGPWPQTCPRRMGEIGPWPRDENQDTWDIREQMHKGLRSRHCSFCGSLHPDDFMRLVEEGWVVGPTDKNYKAYLAPALSDEDVEERHQRFLRSDRARVMVEITKEHHPEMSDDEVQAELERRWRETELPLTDGSGSPETKFSYQHLSLAQRARFIALYNNRINGTTPAMNIGYPGHFYRLPFFMAYSESEPRP